MEDVIINPVIKTSPAELDSAVIFEDDEYEYEMMTKEELDEALNSPRITFDEYIDIINKEFGFNYVKKDAVITDDEEYDEMMTKEELDEALNSEEIPADKFWEDINKKFNF
ncbi:MAG: hypothetical protein Ta2D_03750 [Rickettsiales bacterium]|nr:MAG: hypothetical protein Ta2D_03750 [Rickettsiales bacterium]